jgi:hypothetical protein
VQTGSIEDRLARLEASGKHSDDSEIPAPPAARPERISTLKSLDDANITASSSYPRVAELEQTMLLHTYLGDSIRERLSRLETKAFGQPSKITDLAARVDTLNEYAAVFAVPAEYKKDALDFSGLTASTGLSVGRAPARFVSVVDQIESLESTVFGGMHGDKPLLQRVASLEENVYGTPQGNEDLTSRVAHLWTSVKPGAPSLASVQGFDDTPTQDWRAKQTQLAQLQQAQVQQRQSPTSLRQPVAHRSFLKKIGKALSVAGAVAATAISSATMPYGYGGYSGFGTGYGGYSNPGMNSYGGFGGSFGPSYGLGGMSNFFR